MQNPCVDVRVVGTKEDGLLCVLIGKMEAQNSTLIATLVQVGTKSGVHKSNTRSFAHGYE